MKWWLFGLFAGAGVLLWAGTPAGKVEPWTRENGTWVQSISATLSAASCLARTNGPVVVRGVNENAITCTVRKRVRARSQAEAQRIGQAVKFRFVDRGNYAEFYANHPDIADLSIETEIRVPKSLAKMMLATLAGNIEAYDLNGLRAETAGGNITIDRIASDVLLKTGGGEVKIGHAGASVRCLSGGGAISAGRIAGESWLETAGGDVVVRETGGVLHASTHGGNIRVEKAGASVEARTGGGKIEVLHARGIVMAENSGGSIQIGASPGVRCESSGGAIHLRAATGPVRAVTHIGSILAEVVNGLQNSILSTTNGDITVLIPSKLPLTVKAVNEGERPGWIVSEFAEIPVQRVDAPGLPRFRATGALNGGGPVLVISAIQGTIYLKRR